MPSRAAPSEIAIRAHRLRLRKRLANNLPVRNQRTESVFSAFLCALRGSIAPVMPHPLICYTVIENSGFAMYAVMQCRHDGCVEGKCFALPSSYGVRGSDADGQRRQRGQENKRTRPLCLERGRVRVKSIYYQVSSFWPVRSGLTSWTSPLSCRFVPGGDPSLNGEADRVKPRHARRRSQQSTRPRLGQASDLLALVGRR